MKQFFRFSVATACFAIATWFVVVFASAREEGERNVFVVDAGTNAVFEFEMPFAPAGGGFVDEWLYGPFEGDGSPLSDILFRKSAMTGETTNAVFAATSWVDPATGLPSDMPVEPGDILSLVRTDTRPLEFSLLCASEQDGLVLSRASGVPAGSGGAAPPRSSPGLLPGLRKEFFRMSEKAHEMPDFSTLMPSVENVSLVIDHPVEPWLDGGSLPGNYFACRITGFIDVPMDDAYTFYLTSDDGASLAFDGTTLLVDDSPHAVRTQNAAIFLSAGLHAIEIDFYENRDAEVLRLEWSSQGIARELVPAESLFHAPPDDIPTGLQSGLDVSFYAFPGRILSMPDVSGLVPASTGVWELIDVPDTLLEWPCAPTGLVDHFSAELRGWILVFSPGKYEFSLSSDDGSRLWIDGLLVVDHDGKHLFRAKKGTVCLSAGLHEIRVDYFENEGNAGILLSWAWAGIPAETIPARFFCHGTPPDSDGDGMPDWWEEKFGLDAFDLSDAALDPDGDGLSNLAEFQSGSDPFKADTDGDGMGDAWEIANGVCPFLADGLEDPDGDGLLNIEEMRFGANPLVADTDGDGISDGDERHVYFSNPTSVDFSGGVTTNEVLGAYAVDEVIGDWVVDGQRIALLGRSGTIIYTNDLSLVEAGIRQIRVSYAFSGPCNAELVCRIDGVRSSVALLHASGQVETGDAEFLTQWLPTGIHEVSLEFQNFANGAVFACDGVAICEVDGPDMDGNGRSDWIDSRIESSSVCRTGTVASLVSPYCLRGWHSSEILPSASVANVPLAVRPLPFGGWWADVALDAGQSAIVEVSYENGMKTESVDVCWEEFDVMQGEDLVLRQGDSLLLSLCGRTGVISVDGLTASSDGSAVPYRFDVCGDHAVCADCGDSSRAFTVSVVACSMPNGIPVWRGKTNSVRMSGSGFDLMSVLCDPCADIPALSVSGNDVVCSLSLPLYGRALAFCLEIPNPDASVVTSAELLSFSAFYSLDGVYHVSHHLDDGTSVVENRLSAFDLPDCVMLRLQGNSGICFEDGAGKMSVYADDLDETGDLLYRFLVPESVSNPCQFLFAYFGGKMFAQ